MRQQYLVDAIKPRFFQLLYFSLHGKILLVQRRFIRRYAFFPCFGPSRLSPVGQLTAVIKDSMNEMAAGVQQINRAVHEVNDLARKNKDSIEGLAEEVGKFRL